MNALQDINALGQRERERAFEMARTQVAGPEPQLEDFARRVYSKYPPEHMRRMRRLGYALLVPAFTGSAIRIFLAAYETNATYLTGSRNPALSVPMLIAVLVGLMSVLLAETGQVAFTLWASSVPDDARWMHAALSAGAWGCLAFALAANVFIVKPGTLWQDAGACALAWLETLLPPLLVLIAANVLKSLALNDIENRHAAQMDYETQHAAWQDHRAQAHLHEAWMQTVANELREGIRNANRRSYAKLRALSNEDWRTLVLRELAADAWYVQQALPAVENDTQPEQTDSPLAPEPPRVRVRAASVGTSNSRGKHTGEFAQAVQPNADGTFTGICPHCGWSSVKDSKRGALAALIAHKRSCAGLRADNPVEVLQAAQEIIERVNDGESG